MKKLYSVCLLFLVGMNFTMAQDWIALAPPMGGNIFATHRQGQNVYGTYSNGAFAKSTDGGTTWSAADTVGIPRGTPILLTVTSTGKLIMGKMDIGGPNGMFPMYASTNSGTGWTVISGISAAAGTLIAGPNGKVILVPSYNGMATMKVSSDDGQSWSNTSMIAKSAAFDSNGKIMVLHYNSSAGATQLYASTTNDSTFAAVAGANIDAYSEKITVAPNNTIYVVGGSPKPMVSVNGGASFTAMDSAFTNIWADGGNNLFATKGTNKFYRLENGATAWKDVSNGIGIFGVSGFFFQDNGNVFITSGTSLLKYNGGSSTGLSAVNHHEIEVEIFPQPANTYLNIAAEVNISSVRVYDTNGRQIMATGDSSIDVREFNSGIYTLAITTVDGKSAFRKCVIYK